MDNFGFTVTEEDDEAKGQGQGRRNQKKWPSNNEEFSRSRSSLSNSDQDSDTTPPSPPPLPASIIDGSRSKWESESGCMKVDRVLRAIRHLNVEPIILLHMMALLITALLLSDLTLDRACRINLRYNTSICDEMAERNVSEENKNAETEVQKLVASIGVWRFAIEYAVPIFLVLLLGSWSDVYGRKFPLMLPMFGHMVKVGGLVLCLYFPHWDAVTVTLFQLVPTAVTGSFPIFVMAYHSVIVDTTPEKYRTVRFGFANACQTFGVSLGTALGGNLFSKTELGFLGVFIVSGAIELVNIVLTFVIIRNTKGERSFDSEEIEPVTTTKDALKGMLNLTHLYEALKTTLLSRPNHGRIKLWILIAVLFCASAPYYGESSVIYLFLRVHFGWGAGQYGFFGMYQTIAGGVGVLISMGLLSWWFGLQDCVVGLLGCLSQITSCVMYAFATKTTIYIAPVVDILNGAMVVAARSMTTKSVSTSEQGKILSFLAGLDSVNPVVTNIAYNNLYRETVDFLPGAFFLLSAALATLPLAVFSYFSCRLLGGSDADKKSSKNGQIT